MMHADKLLHQVTTFKNRCKAKHCLTCLCITAHINTHHLNCQYLKHKYYELIDLIIIYFISVQVLRKM